jgi:hypothetical protein
MIDARDVGRTKLDQVGDGPARWMVATAALPGRRTELGVPAVLARTCPVAQRIDQLNAAGNGDSGEQGRFQSGARCRVAKVSGRCGARQCGIRAAIFGIARWGS